MRPSTGPRARRTHSTTSRRSSKRCWTPAAAAGCEPTVMSTTTDHPVQEATGTPPAPGRSPRISDRWLAIGFISPAMLLLLGMSVFPLLWALYLSFTDYSATRDVPARWIGFENYTTIL